MMARLVPPALIAGLLLAFSAIAAACDGGGELTLGEYFQQLDELDNKLSEREDPLNKKLEEEASFEVARETIPQFIPIIQDFTDGLADLDPPAEAEGAHDELLGALNDFLAAFQEIVDNQLPSATSFDDFGPLFEEGEFAAAEQRATDTCLALEQLAADNGITIDLDCEEEDSD